MNSNNVNHNNLIAIVGPTASGKTDLAIKLAKKVKGAVISADSRQIYKDIPIGTNQPSGKWHKFLNAKAYFVEGVPHFFIDILSPNKRYSAAEFQQAVYKLLPKLQAANYLPILVGGTGLYLSSVIEKYKFPAEKPSLKIRNQLKKLTLPQLLLRLKQADPKTYDKIDKKNTHRVIRAIELTLSPTPQKMDDRPNFTVNDYLILGLNPNRQNLYVKINQRVDKMMGMGLLKEVEKLLKKYPQSPALATIGYQELVPVIKNGAILKPAIELIKQHTRNFAKRQMTWFKRIPNVRWVTPVEAEKLVKEI